MSQEAPQGKRELAEAMLAALNARDFTALGEMPFHPDLEFHSAFAATEGEVYHGIQGLRDWAAAVDSTFERFSAELVEFRELDEERALAVVHVMGQAKASGVPVEARMAQIWTWRNGKMWRNEVFTDERVALRAAGLSE